MQKKTYTFEKELLTLANKIKKNMFKNLFSFKGRIRRTVYGTSFIIYIVLLYILSSYQQILANNLIETNKELTSFYLSFLLYIPLMWFILCQNAKRCHDRGNSGMCQFIPFYIFWMIFAKGEDKANKYDYIPEKLDSVHRK